ncbi:unnamed protein product [Brachionus calyciflorus]|uniref:K Homology domain-containing protein n=1 Tax=Brachionus calyciflorus TaxID=104777 RepID=A0A813MCX1_9BILA|nr:unnamed protein product [Brachionus calyciflorus]
MPQSTEDLLCSQFSHLSTDEQSHHRSQNITESVHVPSSEHVAEIVGRQGCKIKALRAKTNTYIKTPIRGEAPMFVITGRREDVLTAKREIQLAADHFSQIRAKRGSASPTPAPASPKQISRPSSISPSLTENSLIYKHNLTYQAQPALLPGQISKKVNVPYQVVGLVVGPKGSTIKRIQQNTNTYIITPSRDCEPVFEIQGMPECVEAAKIEIENYIQLRTNQSIPKETIATQPVSLSSSCSGSVGLNDLINDDLNDFNLYQSVVNSVVDDDDPIWTEKPGQNLDVLISSFQNRSNSSSSSSSSTSSSFCSNELSLNYIHNSFMFGSDSVYSPLMDLYPTQQENSHILNSIFQHEQLLQQLQASNQINQDFVFNDSIF